MSKKKILVLTMVLGVATVFSGCGKAVNYNEPPEQTVTPSSEAQVETSLPAPTGKIEDAVSAIESEAMAESSSVAEDDDAEALLDDFQETDVFGQSYDENEF